MYRDGRLNLDTWAARLLQLTWLDLSHTLIRREDLTVLRKLGKLRQLNLTCCEVCSENLDQAVDLPLYSLGVGIDPDGVTDVVSFFRKGGGKALECLDFDIPYSDHQFTANEVAGMMDCLRGISPLRRLDLYTGFNMMANIGLLASLVQLTALRFWVPTLDGIEDVTKLTALTRLQELSLDESGGDEFQGLGVKVMEMLSSSLPQLKLIEY